MKVTLSPEQQEVVDAVIERVRKGDRLITIGGYAGAGKTTIARSLYEKLPKCAVCAYTGKAADRLKMIDLPAATIHSTIYQPKDDPKARGGVRFERKSLNEIGAKHFLIDEGSMIGREELDNLKSYHIPLIVLGDHGQLPPVNEDTGLMRNPDHRLEKIHRNAGPIAAFAEHLRKGGSAREWKSGDGVWIVNRREITAQQMARADQVICAFNKTRVGLNRTIRSELGLPEKPVVGDRVICLQNDRSAGCFTGQQGVIDIFEEDNLLLRFKPRWGEPVIAGYHPKAWNAEKAVPRVKDSAPGYMIPFDFAYAVTCHKAQGDEWEKVIVFEEFCKLWEHRRWAYTAASRAREKLLWGV